MDYPGRNEIRELGNFAEAEKFPFTANAKVNCSLFNLFPMQQKTKKVVKAPF